MYVNEKPPRGVVRSRKEKGGGDLENNKYPKLIHQIAAMSLETHKVSAGQGIFWQLGIFIII